ncbi:acyloxyacyl hydrolase [Thermodesulfobacteriota bacterium]
MGLAYRVGMFFSMVLTVISIQTCLASPSTSGGVESGSALLKHHASGNVDSETTREKVMRAVRSPQSSFKLSNNYFVKLAYGRTFGTCTELDYATVELSRRVKRFETKTFCGPTLAELQVAVMGSYVLYKEGKVERIKSLDFQDGYEVGWVPKGRVTLSSGPIGMMPYMESGAGLSYVSETYRNSGSRWNWSLLAGMGVEKHLPGLVRVSLGLQWRHLSNGNMWGAGDELHNSNSGTDMIQGSASLVHLF